MLEKLNPKVKALFGCLGILIIVDALFQDPAILLLLIPLAIIGLYSIYWQKIDKKMFWIFSALIAAWLIFFTIKYLLNFDDYSEEELVDQSYFFLPPLIAFVVGFFTSWEKLNKLSLVIALLAGVGTYYLLPLFYDTIWLEL